MTWEDHVMLEISDAFGDPERLLVIQVALSEMLNAGLIPEEVADRLFNYFGSVAGL